MPDKKPAEPAVPPARREPPKEKAGEKEGQTPPASRAHTIHGLAAELKNEIRADRMRQADRRRKPL